MVHSLDRYKHPVAVRMRTNGRIRCSTVQKHPISGSIKDVFDCGGQIGVHFCHFLFAQVPQRADWRTFSPFFVLQDAPEEARGPLLNVGEDEGGRPASGNGRHRALDLKTRRAVPVNSSPAVGHPADAGPCPAQGSRTPPHKAPSIPVNVLPPSSSPSKGTCQKNGLLMAGPHKMNPTCHKNAGIMASPRRPGPDVGPAVAQDVR